MGRWFVLVKHSYRGLCATSGKWLVDIDILVSHDASKSSAWRPGSASEDNVTKFHRLDVAPLQE